MPFKPPRKPPQFADLKGILAQTKDTENPLYQVVQQIIERLDQQKEVVKEQIAAAAVDPNLLKNLATKFATYHTKEDETSVLPNSWQLIAGEGIIFNDSTLNQRIISVAGFYDAPLSDGDLDEASLIFADGECIIVQVPV